MASRSWNRVELLGNLTRDPELRFTPSGAAVCSFGVATNRTFTSDGEKKEEVDFHKVVAWNKLAELCNQLLKKGSRVFIAGRLQYREWETSDGQKKREAEIVIEDMIQLTPKSEYLATDVAQLESGTAERKETPPIAPVQPKPADDTKTNPPANESVSDEDLPF